MTAPAPSPVMPRPRALSQVSEKPVAWLWPGRLALGHLSMLEGDPGLGKSFVTLDLCARLSTGRAMPDNAPLGLSGAGFRYFQGFSPLAIDGCPLGAA